jgi:hypothetical protein
MKMDLNTSGTYQQSKAMGGTKADLLGKKIPLKGIDPKAAVKASSPDYKLDLSSASSSTPSPSLPSMPSMPSLPESSPSVPDSSVARSKIDPDLVKDLEKNIAKETAKEEAKKEIKAEKTEEIKDKEGSVKRPAIIFIKGLDVFSSPSKSERGYAGMSRLADSVKDSKVFGWADKDDIIEEIKKREKNQPIIIVGHSFGGDTAVEVANELDSLENNFRGVDLLVTIDAIGFNNDIIPQNVKKHLNVFGEKSWPLDDGPHVARRHEMTDVKNILSPLSHTDIDDDKEVQYEIVTMIQKSLTGFV